MIAGLFGGCESQSEVELIFIFCSKCNNLLVIFKKKLLRVSFQFPGVTNENDYLKKKVQNVYYLCDLVD